VVLSSALPLEPLFIRPEGFFDKIGEFFGGGDIDFESAEFSRRFYVKADDRRWAYDVIHQRTMEFLLNRPKSQIQFDRNSTICWTGRTFDPSGFEAAFGTIEGILDGFPEYLVRQLSEKSLTGGAA
jgi:hypothetical protein